MKLKVLLIGILFLTMIVAAGCSQKAAESLPVQEITMFKSPNCGCCDIWAQYMRKEGFQVNVENVANMDAIKSELKISRQLESCHTAKIGEYFVEGHIPIEAIKKLMTEKPDIAGIAMPGMPSGSPGMPGRKSREWVIYSVNNDGTYREFMRV